MRDSLARLGRSNVASYAASVAPIRRPTRFLVMGTARSGSELLSELIGQLPGTVCAGEVFHRNVVRSPIRYLEGRARTSAARGNRAWGCKVLTVHLLPEEDRLGPAEPLVKRLVERGWQLVHLRRRDLLSMAVSHLQARDTGLWHARDGAEALPLLDADPETIFAWLHAADAHRTWLDDLVEPHPRVTVTYEDDLLAPGRHQQTADMVARHLEVPTGPVKATIRKLGNRDPLARLRHRDAFERLLRTTSYASLLDDDSVSRGHLES